MKKFFLTLFLSAIIGMAMAQTVKTYSVYDVNHNGKINVADVTKVVDKAKSNTSVTATQQSVLADDLATTLQSLDNRLAAIEDKLASITIGGDGVNILPGKFTVNAQGKQVQFTKGNLYWDGTAFKFEATQIASSQGNYESNAEDVYDPNHVSHFFWTSAADFKKGNVELMPYAETYSYSSQTFADKFWCGEENPLTVEGTSDLYALKGLVDGEWYYIFYSRDNCNKLYKTGVTVTDGTQTAVNCLIIAPDDFDFTTNPLKESYNLNEIKSLNLVCIPAAGYRSRNQLRYSGEYGQLWASTLDTNYASDGCEIQLSDGEIVSISSAERGATHSIRLVRTVK